MFTKLFDSIFNIFGDTKPTPAPKAASITVPETLPVTEAVTEAAFVIPPAPRACDTTKFTKQHLNIASLAFATHIARKGVGDYSETQQDVVDNLNVMFGLHKSRTSWRTAVAAYDTALANKMADAEGN